MSGAFSLPESARRAGTAAPRRTAGALLALLCVSAFWLSACAVHPGSDEIAFVRNGQLWTVYSDGSDATEIASGGIVGFAWSPDHHQLVLRFAGKGATIAARGSVPDAVSNLAVTGVDGGSPVQITPDVRGIARSDAWWDATGNRLLYREGFPSTPGQEPSSVVYVVSQADQPAGIARKLLLDVALIPALAPDGSQVAVVDAEGDVRVGKPGEAGQIVASGALGTLPGGTRPARLLWRPLHSDLLYASAGPGGATRLVLSTPAGHAESSLDLDGLLDYCFAPDGDALLTQTARGFAVWPLQGTALGQSPTMSWPASESTALAWWSPTSRAVLVEDSTGYSLANLTTNRTTTLVRTPATPALAASAPSWHPLTGSPWDAAGDAFVFRDTGTGTWNGSVLPTPHGSAGLYVGSVANPSQPPRLIDSGDDWAPSWSYLAPGASWLTPS